MIMQNLLILAGVAFTSSYATQTCGQAYAAQHSCFLGVVLKAFGSTDSEDKEPSTIKTCLEQHGCHGDLGMFDAAPTRHRRELNEREVKKEHVYNRMKDCFSEKNNGSDPYELLSECVRQEIGKPLPSTFVIYHARNDVKKVFNNEISFFYRLLKFMAMSGQLGARVTEVCGGNETKKDAVRTCLRNGTGIDIEALISRDQIRRNWCDKKMSCYTEKMLECKQSKLTMLVAGCDCKTNLLNGAMAECAAELNITLSEKATMACAPLIAQEKTLYDMCDPAFEFPADDIYT
jgi:hypothetical protein